MLIVSVEHYLTKFGRLVFVFFPVENEGTLKYLAKVYATNHPKMHLGDAGCSNNGQSMYLKYSEA